MTALRITPAYAGTTKMETAMIDGIKDHPRLRGDHDIESPSSKVVMGSPPLTRGPLRSKHRPSGLFRITPAYAGTTIQQVLAVFFIQDHPRLRGDHLLLPVDPCGIPGSPPLTRGPHPLVVSYHTVKGITPAYAGTTRVTRSKQAFGPDHPRLRGDHSLVHILTGRFPGSPPLTRGPPFSFQQLANPPRITPAYAGTTKTSD